MEMDIFKHSKFSLEINTFKIPSWNGRSSIIFIATQHEMQIECKNTRNVNRETGKIEYFDGCCVAVPTNADNKLY